MRLPLAAVRISANEERHGSWTLQVTLDHFVLLMLAVVVLASGCVLGDGASAKRVMNLENKFP